MTRYTSLAAYRVLGPVDAEWRPFRGLCDPQDALRGRGMGQEGCIIVHLPTSKQVCHTLADAEALADALYC